MKICFLILGTVSGIIFAAALLKGRAYDYMIEPLDSDAFPIKGIYSSGIVLAKWKLFRMRGKPAAKLREAATLYYGAQYGEYYAQMIWAQILSYILLCFTLFMLLAGAVGSGGVLFALIGIVLCAAAAYYFYSYTQGKIDQRRDECNTEFPNAISKLALLVNSGVILRDAWKDVAFGKEGTFYTMMRDACVEMDNGKSDIDAIYAFGMKSASPEIKKFTSALVQSLERGGGELSLFLAGQTTELWSLHRQTMLQKGEKAAGALLAPIALMFVGVILLIMAAALQSFSF